MYYLSRFRFSTCLRVH